MNNQENMINMLMVGDSISEHQHISWSNQFCANLGLRFVRTMDLAVIISQDYHILVIFLATVWDYQCIMLVMIDYLLLMKLLLKVPSRAKISQSINGIMALNRGAHYETDSALLDTLNGTLKYISENYLHISVVCRNTPYGNRQFDKFVMAALHKEPPYLLPNAPFHHQLNGDGHATDDVAALQFPRIVTGIGTTNQNNYVTETSCSPPLTAVPYAPADRCD